MDTGIRYFGPRLQVGRTCRGRNVTLYKEDGGYIVLNYAEAVEMRRLLDDMIK